MGRRRASARSLAAGALCASALALARGAACFASWARPRAAARRAQSRLPLAAIGKDSSSWALPSVDKDTDYFIEGRAGTYAWMQTSETLYLFAPIAAKEDGGEGEKTKCLFEISEEGTHVRFDVAGANVLQGKLAGGVKVGTEVWMIEDAPGGGGQFAIAEVDKLTPGDVFTSVIAPDVEFSGSYDQPEIVLAGLSPEQQEATVEETLQHIRAQKRTLQDRPDDHLAVEGDVLTVSIRGFEVGPDGSRGAPLDLGAAEGTKFELGGGGFLPEMHSQLVGVSKGEERDVRVTLKRGSMGGQEIICGVTCQLIEEQVLPELDDEFARELKRSEQQMLAATEEGVPWEEQGQADTWTVADLRKEINNEIMMAAQKQEKESVEAQLEEALLRTAVVQCEWADMASQRRETDGKELDGAALEMEEVKAAVYDALVFKEGLEPLVDHDMVTRQTWNSLGKPKEGEQIAEVGSDPAREFQEAHKKVLRRHRRDVALKWLEERAKVVSAEAA